MKIRRATINDVDAVRTLFYETITEINAKDYSPEQIVVWAGGYNNTENWKNKIIEQNFFVAENKNEILGFGSITTKGCLDLLYVHKNHQREGIASALLKRIGLLAANLEISEILADVSITAKPFFLKKGFKVREEYIKQHKGVDFKNTIMYKEIKNFTNA